ncbi:MAG: hypothetical protein ABI528_02905 [bacterium]
MKQRILSGWTFTRALFVVLGSAVIISSVINHQWIGVLLGSYFASMGIFAFGCAAGNCLGGRCGTEVIHQSKAEVQDNTKSTHSM